MLEKSIAVLGIIAIVSVLMLVLTYPLMLCWNYVFSAGFNHILFGIDKINYWRMFLVAFVIAGLGSTGRSVK